LGRFSEDGITNEVVKNRRKSSYFVPIAKPKKKGKQLVLSTEWTEDRIEENRFINDVRRAVLNRETHESLGTVCLPDREDKRRRVC
jgi:hypothetical protein